MILLRAQMADFDSQPAPQFGKAEYLGEPGADRCAACGQPVVHEYYRVNGAMACPSCAANAQTSVAKDTHAAFVRAVLFGIAAAILGLILYSAFGIITGLVIGYLSLAVGYMVGKAMLMGSRGIGGRRYQIVAVLLTYSAVSMSAIPIAISMQSKAREQRQEQTRKLQDQHRQALSDEQRQLEKEFGQQHTERPPVQNTPPAEVPQQAKMSPAAALGYLALIGLASPFLELQDPVHGFIGLIILLVGIRIAWQLTAAKLPEVSGPFHTSATT
jgi:hypothetical protein